MNEEVKKYYRQDGTMGRWEKYHPATGEIEVRSYYRAGGTPERKQSSTTNRRDCSLMDRTENLRKLLLFAYKEFPELSWLKIHKAIFIFDSFWHSATGVTFTGSLYNEENGKGKVICEDLYAARAKLCRECWLHQAKIGYYLTQAGEKKVKTLWNTTEEERANKGFYLSIVKEIEKMDREEVIKTDGIDGPGSLSEFFVNR